MSQQQQYLLQRGWVIIKMLPVGTQFNSARLYTFQVKPL